MFHSYSALNCKKFQFKSEKSRLIPGQTFWLSETPPILRFAHMAGPSPSQFDDDEFPLKASFSGIPRPFLEDLNG